MQSKLVKWLASTNEHSMAFLLLGLSILLSCTAVGIFNGEAAAWVSRKTFGMGLHLNGGRISDLFGMLPYMVATGSLVIMGGYLTGLKVAGWLGLIGMTALWALPTETIVPTVVLVVAWVFTITTAVLTSETYMGTIYMDP